MAGYCSKGRHASSSDDTRAPKLLLHHHSKAAGTPTGRPLIQSRCQPLTAHCSHTRGSTAISLTTPHTQPKALHAPLVSCTLHSRIDARQHSLPARHTSHTGPPFLPLHACHTSHSSSHGTVVQVLWYRYCGTGSVASHPQPCSLAQVAEPSTRALGLHSHMLMACPLHQSAKQQLHLHQQLSPAPTGSRWLAQRSTHAPEA